MRKILHIFLSLVIVYAGTVSAYAASPTGWSVSPADVIMSGASATITAIKGSGASALQSTVQHAPTVANIGKNILKGAGGVAVAYAVTELIGAGVDWVLDPANNRIKYGGEGTCEGVGWYSYGNESTVGFHSTISGACAAHASVFAPTKPWSVSGTKCIYGGGAGKVLSNAGVCDSSNPTYKQLSEPQYIPVATVAQRVQSNAAAGHSPSQDFIKTIVIDDVNAGYVDSSLNTNAVPVADAPPEVPPADPEAPPVPFDPSSLIAAIKSVMAAVVNMSGVLSAKIDALMVDLGLKHQEKLVADAANTAAIVAAVGAISGTDGNTLDGELINEAVDRAIAAGNADAASIVAAIEAIEGNSLDADVINEAVDRVIANDKAIAEKVAAEKAAADKAAAEQFEEVPPEKTQSETDVPVDLPPEVKNASEFDVDYIGFSSQCPSLPSFSVGVMGYSSSMSFDMSPLCDLAVTIRPAIIAIAYFIGLGVIASAIRET